jgi:hypothetical protein
MKIGQVNLPVILSNLQAIDESDPFPKEERPWCVALSVELAAASRQKDQPLCEKLTRSLLLRRADMQAVATGKAQA